MLRTISKIALVVAVFAVSAFAQRVGDAMNPRRANTQVYANQVRESFETPIVAIGPEDLVTVVEVDRRQCRIRTVGGIQGWVECNTLSRPSNRGSNASRAFTFEAAEVQGYLDNPTPVYIIDMNDTDSDPIELNRSFREALQVNVDRETLERISR